MRRGVEIQLRSSDRSYDPTCAEAREHGRVEIQLQSSDRSYRHACGCGRRGGAVEIQLQSSRDPFSEHVKKLKKLTHDQIVLVSELVDALSRPIEAQLYPSDLVDDKFLTLFGEELKRHHCFSREPFTKDKFEYALQRVMTKCGHSAELASRGNRGHDITINGQALSLKTQADRDIKANFIHISKFMELGRGQWESESDLYRLRDEFLAHLERYERILSLRCLSKGAEGGGWAYELVEIPKSLLLRASTGAISMLHGSKQSHKPGTCDVLSGEKALDFQLYFDGGSERKLQVRRLRKDLCQVHAEWRFVSDL